MSVGKRLRERERENKVKRNRRWEWNRIKKKIGKGGSIDKGSAGVKERLREGGDTDGQRGGSKL